MIQVKHNPNEVVGYVLRIELVDFKPKIWREFEVPANMALSRFHVFIQICMGWEGGHLHQFIAGGTYYGIPDEHFDDDDTIPEDKHVISEFFHEKGSKLFYEYDFGDSWEHLVKCKKVLKRKDREYVLPLVLGGERACPPEDCGGVWGYGDLLEIISNPKHKEYGSMIEWLGGEFNPDKFDLEEINKEVQKEFEN